MKVFIVGTKDKGNLYKDGRFYAKESTAKRVAGMKQQYVIDQLEVLPIEVETDAEKVVKLEKENQKLIWAIDEICKTMNEEKVNLGMMTHVAEVARNAQKIIQG